MKELKGKTIHEIRVSSGEETMFFLVELPPDSNWLAYSVAGDCCSTSWFADVLGVDSLLGEEVLKVRKAKLKDYNTEDGRTRQEEDSVYGYTLETKKGRTDIIFRNSSNGYYGGWLCSPVRKAPEVTDSKIEADWSA